MEKKKSETALEHSEKLKQTRQQYLVKIAGKYIPSLFQKYLTFI